MSNKIIDCARAYNALVESITRNGPGALYDFVDCYNDLTVSIFKVKRINFKKKNKEKADKFFELYEYLFDPDTFKFIFFDVIKWFAEFLFFSRKYMYQNSKNDRCYTTYTDTNKNNFELVINDIIFNQLITFTFDKSKIQKINNDPFNFLGIFDSDDNQFLRFIKIDVRDNSGSHKYMKLIEGEDVPEADKEYFSKFIQIMYENILSSFVCISEDYILGSAYLDNKYKKVRIKDLLEDNVRVYRQSKSWERNFN